MDIIDAFLKAMRDHGLTPVFRAGEGIQFGQKNGKPNRFHVEGDSRGTQNGWYVLFGDGIPAGEFGSWKTGTSHTWCARDIKTLSRDERESVTKRIEEARKERERVQKLVEGEAAKAANLLWNDATVLEGDDHPYLQRKGVRNHGLRIGAWPIRNRNGEAFRHVENTLLIPIMDVRGRIVSLQGIFPAPDEFLGRDKSFLPDGRKRGCFYLIGRAPAGEETVCICEGYATGATIHEATGWCVVIGWDAYNLSHVAKVMREAMPRAKFVIAADNDQFTKDNPGVTYGRKAAMEIGARLVVPEFADLEGKPTDFNDLAQREGIEVAQTQLLPPPASPGATPPIVGNPAPTNHNSQIALWDELGLELNGRGTPLMNIDNAVRVIEGHRDLLGRIWYDEFTRRIMSNWADASEPCEWGDPDTLKLTLFLQRAIGLSGITPKTVDAAVNIAAYAHRRNSAQEWLRNLTWDGTKRLEQLLPRGFGTVESEYTAAVGRCFVVGMVARILQPGCKVDTMPVFEGAQGLGKSTALRVLAGDAWFAEAAESVTSKDFFVGLQGKALIEIGELDTFSRAEVTAVKRVLSCQSDRFRAPYERRAIDHPRSSVFAGTTNRDDWNRDETGARRFWPVACTTVDLTWIREHRKQLFAEAVARFDRKECWWDVPADVARNEQDARREIDEWQEPIERYLADKEETQVSDVFEFALDMKPEKWTKPHQMRVAAILRSMGWSRKLVRREGSRPMRVWRRGSKVSNDRVERALPTAEHAHAHDLW